MKKIKGSKWIKGGGYRKKIILEKLRGDINLVEEAIIEPGGEIPIHRHKFTKEIFLIAENSAIMVVGNKKSKVKSGDMIQVDKGEKHGFINKNKKEFKLIVFKIGFRQGDSYLK